MFGTKGLTVFSLALLALTALVIAACAPAPVAQPTAAPPTSAPAATTAPADATTAPAATSAPAATTAPSAGANKFYYVTPSPIGVNAFLQLGQAGLEAAAKKHNAEFKTLESENDPSSREENVRAAINDGANVVIVLGFEFADIIPKVASESPNVDFIIIDQCIDPLPANVRCAVFREYEAAYLLGAEAGLLTKSNKVAAISAIDIPFLHRYTDAFIEGAKAVNPNITDTAVRWIGTDPSAFSDPAKAKEQALALAGQGYDQIFAAGAASNLGIFEAAKEQNFQTYGVDINQCPSAAGFVVDNLLKRVDNAVVAAVDASLGGEPGGVSALGLKEGGIGIVPFAEPNAADSQCLIMENQEVIDKVKELQDQIISGELTVADPMNP
jgi:basic membrane protein A